MSGRSCGGCTAVTYRCDGTFSVSCGRGARIGVGPGRGAMGRTAVRPFSPRRHARIPSWCRGRWAPGSSSLSGSLLPLDGERGRLDVRDLRLRRRPGPPIGASLASSANSALTAIVFCLHFCCSMSGEGAAPLTSGRG